MFESAYIEIQKIARGQIQANNIVSGKYNNLHMERLNSVCIAFIALESMIAVALSKTKAI